MFAADAEFDVRAGGAAAFGGHAHQGADAFAVERDERVFFQDALFDIGRQEFAGVIARQAERGLRQVVGAEGEEVGDLGDFVGDDAGARQFDHGADDVFDFHAGFGEHFGGDFLDLGAGDFQFLAGADQRDHDFGHRGVAGFLGDGDRAFKDGAGLHFVDFRVGNAEAAAAMAEHGVGFGKFAGTAAHGGEVAADGLGEFFQFRVGMRQEFMQRRVQQADGDGQAGHDAEQVGEVLALERQQLGQRRATAGFVMRHDHLADGGDAGRVEEHMFGAAQADALGAEFARGIGIQRGFGVGAHLHPADAVGPAHQGGEIVRHRRLDHGDAAEEDLPRCAIQGDGIADIDGFAGGGQGLRVVIHRDATGAGHAGPAHAAGDHGGVAGHAATGGQDAAGGVHAVNVFRGGFDAHQNDGFALGGAHFGFIGAEHHRTTGGAGAGRQAFGEQIAGRFRVQCRVQQLVQRGRINPQDGFLAVDQPFIGHIHGDAHGGGGGAFAVAGLQHVELAGLHGKLDILHVLVVAFERGADGHQLVVGARHCGFHRLLARLGAGGGHRLRGADAGDDVLALRVDQVFAVEDVFAG